MSVEMREKFEDRVRKAINIEMSAISSEMVDEAIEKITAQLRKRVGEIAAAVLEHSYDMSTDGSYLTIRVQLAPRK
jgi:hypothetical protein